MTIWFRSLFMQFLLMITYIITVFFIIYTVVDLSINGMHFMHTGSKLNIVMYYVSAFSMQMRLFLPVAFLFALLKILFDLVHHSELIALQMAGLSRKQILMPCVWVTGLLTLFLYANEEWVVPHAGERVDGFSAKHLSHRHKKKQHHLLTVPLEDETEIVFQSFNEGTGEFFDLFWIRAPEEIWHAQHVHCNEQGIFQGLYVDLLGRGEEGIFKKKASYDQYLFRELKLNLGTVQEQFVPFHYRSLSTLFEQTFSAHSDQASIAVHLHYKLAVPLLLFLILIGVAPYALQFRRVRYTFAITALSLFSLIALMTLFDGLLILGANQVFPAGVVIWAPFFLFFGIAIYIPLGQKLGFGPA